METDLNDPTKPVPSAKEVVTNITYNQYGERQRIDYGNGTFTEYGYDDLRRMQNLGHQFFGAASTYTVEKEYAYDKVSNVIQIETLNNGQLLPNTEDGVLAGPILHNYYYDDFNRLIGADGWYVGPDDEPSDLLRQEYTLDMAYDESHNILNKAQNHLRGSADPNDTSIFLNNISEAMEDTAYNLDYEDYASGSFTTGGHSYVQPHAPRTIVEYPYGGGADEPSAKRKLLDYDANGNLLLVEQEISDPEDPLGKAKISLRENLWDEENRLLAVDLKPEAPSNKPEVAAYTYDASGERTIKYLPGRLDAYYSAKAAGSADRLESILYPSPLLTVKTRPLPDGINPEVLERTSITKYTKHYYIGTERIASAIGTMKNLGLLCENNWPGNNDLVNEMGTKTIDAGDVMTADYDAFEKELQLSEPFIYETYLPCEGKYHEPDNYDAYWYHPDHLGSSSYITNLAGEVSQHMEYLPFGEALVEEHLNSYNSPYKFNAKQYDAETGWYYYGARYYSPKYNLMLGVDPASDLYPAFSPYAYTLQNPVRYIDPTGMTADDVIIKGKNAQKAFEQLQASTDLELDMVDGKVEIIGGKATSESDKKLQEAITDEKITVNINTTDGFTIDEYTAFVGGAFRGSTVNKDGTVDANQLVNPEVLGKMDEYYERGHGTGIKHEILEGFIGGQESPGSDPATTKSGYANYLNAHGKAKNLDLRYKNNTGKVGFHPFRTVSRRGMSGYWLKMNPYLSKEGKQNKPLNTIYVRPKPKK